MKIGSQFRVAYFQSDAQLIVFWDEVNEKEYIVGSCSNGTVANTIAQNLNRAYGKLKGVTALAEAPSMVEIVDRIAYGR